MAYEKQQWRNGPEGGTPTSAKRFNHIEKGIAALSETITTIEKGLSSLTDTAVRATRKITAGTGLNGGGDLTEDRTISVRFGAEADTVCEGNDSRLSNQRTPANGSVNRDKLATDVKSDIDTATRSEDFSEARVMSSAEYDALSTNADPNTIYYVYE